MNNYKIVENIEQFYKSIYPICPLIDKCNKEKSDNFSQKPKMSYIGREYGNSRAIPNLLFLSLDSGGGEEVKFTIEDIRDEVENRTDFSKFNGRDRQKHWFQTFWLGKIILEPFLNEKIQAENDVKPYIVHTNSAKCNQGKPNRSQADKLLFTNCMSFVKDEIPYYNPDIIITQGNRAWDVMGQYQTIEEKNFRIGPLLHSKNEEITIYAKKIGNKIAFHIPLYHPRYGGFKWQKQCLEHNMYVIKEKLEELKISKYT